MRDEKRRGSRRKKCRIVRGKEEGERSQRNEVKKRMADAKEGRRGEDRKGRNEMMKSQMEEHDKEEETGMMAKELEVCQVRRKEKLKKCSEEEIIDR